MTYKYDNFSDLRHEVDDSIITIENSQNTSQLLLYAFEKYGVFWPSKFVRTCAVAGTLHSALLQRLLKVF
jgi:hypothetical protein